MNIKLTDMENHMIVVDPQTIDAIRKEGDHTWVEINATIYVVKESFMTVMRKIK